jgi:hypothetical protein
VEIRRVIVEVQPRQRFFNYFSNISINDWVWWHVPFILVAWESTNRRIVVQVGPGKK